MTRTQRLVGAGLTWICLVGIWIVLALALDGNLHWGPPNQRDDQCETLRASAFVREFQNTWSNVAYLAAGVLVLFHARHRLGFATGAAFCYVAFCSGMYHASVRDPWQLLDIAGVYWAMLALIVYGVHAIWERRWKLPALTSPPAILFKVAVTITIPLVLAHVMAKFRTEFLLFKSEIAFGYLALALLFLMIVVLRALKDESLDQNLPPGAPNGRPLRHLFFWIAMGTTAVGLVFRLLDGKDKPFCLPGNVFQAHAHWHVLSAGALLLAYDFFSRCAGDRGRIFGE